MNRDIQGLATRASACYGLVECVHNFFPIRGLLSQLSRACPSQKPSQAIVKKEHSRRFRIPFLRKSPQKTKQTICSHLGANLCFVSELSSPGSLSSHVATMSARGRPPNLTNLLEPTCYTDLPTQTNPNPTWHNVWTKRVGRLPNCGFSLHSKWRNTYVLKSSCSVRWKCTSNRRQLISLCLKVQMSKIAQRRMPRLLQRSELPNSVKFCG